MRCLPRTKTGTRVHSDVPPERKPERGYVRMFLHKPTEEICTQLFQEWVIKNLCWGKWKKGVNFCNVTATNAKANRRTGPFPVLGGYCNWLLTSLDSVLSISAQADWTGWEGTFLESNDQKKKLISAMKCSCKMLPSAQALWQIRRALSLNGSKACHSFALVFLGRSGVRCVSGVRCTEGRASSLKNAAQDNASPLSHHKTVVMAWTQTEERPWLDKKTKSDRKKAEQGLNLRTLAKVAQLCPNHRKRQKMAKIGHLSQWNGSLSFDIGCFIVHAQNSTVLSTLSARQDE